MQVEIERKRGKNISEYYFDTSERMNSNGFLNQLTPRKHTYVLMVKNETKNFYYQEKYRLYMKGKKTQFDKKYSLLQAIYENT